MRTGKMVVLLLLAFTVLAVPGSAATPITSCMVIDQPGTYELTRDLQNMDPGLSGACIDVQASATIEGRGHTLEGMGSGTGISIHGMDVADGTTVRNMVLTDWGEGIGVTAVYGIAISGCSLRNNDYGIGVADGGMTIRDSIIKGGDLGIDCEPLSGCSVYNSQIVDNTVGILMWDGTSGTIANNYFRNTVNADLRGMPESTALNTQLASIRNIIGGKWSGGNYWASPDGAGYSQACVDANRNGICDQSYDLGGGFIDNYPLTGNVKGKMRK